MVTDVKEKYDEIKDFTKYEKARMIGSRALQISMGAPFLVKLEDKDLKEIKYNPVEIAKIEFEKGVLPITIKRPMPKPKV
jgi:DNA-directed RNA polymerase subunit K